MKELGLGFTGYSAAKGRKSERDPWLARATKRSRPVASCHAADEGAWRRQSDEKRSQRRSGERMLQPGVGEGAVVPLWIAMDAA